jgi:hypothetical protein
VNKATEDLEIISLKGNYSNIRKKTDIRHQDTSKMTRKCSKIYEERPDIYLQKHNSNMIY